MIKNFIPALVLLSVPVLAAEPAHELDGRRAKDV
jgi:hypothetical protein